MTMGEAVITCFRKIFVYRGRARRSEYWYFYLFAGVLNVVIGIWDRFFPVNDEPFSINNLMALVTVIIQFAIALAWISVSVRRFHDLNRSGFWLLAPVFLFAFGLLLEYLGLTTNTLNQILLFALLASGLAILIAMAIGGTDGTNKYGLDPLDEMPERHVFD